MLDLCYPPNDATCASCGQSAAYRLVAMNYPDQQVLMNKDLEAYVEPNAPRPFPATFDLCDFCWRTLYGKISSHVYKSSQAEEWTEFLRPYPPGVNVRQPDGRYRSAYDIRIEERLRDVLDPDGFKEYQREIKTFKRKLPRGR